MNQKAIRAQSGRRSLIALASALALEGILFAACLIGFVSMASAEVINIPAVTFVPRDIADGIDSSNGRSTNGVLDKAGGRYYAAVIFPSAGNVCALALVYRDNEPQADLTVKLFKKRVVIGQSPFAEPLLMAALQSNGVDAGTRRLIERNVLWRAIDLSNAFYYVELNVPKTSLQVVGVQVNYRPTACPP